MFPDSVTQAGEEVRGAGQMEGTPPDTVQSLQHEIEVIKAKIAQEREKIRVSEAGVGLLMMLFSGQDTAAGG